MSAALRHVLVSCRQMQDGIDEFRDELRSHQIEVSLPQIEQQLTEADLLPIIGAFDGVIAGDDFFTARVLQNAPRLKVISKWGVGIDGIDREAAARLDIAVTNTPDVFGSEVADVAIGYVIMLARGLHLIDRGVRAGSWPKPRGRTLACQTLGIVGLGSIGRAVAARGLAVGMRVVGADPAESSRVAAQAIGVNTMDLDDVFAVSDYVSVNCPMTPANFHLVDARRLALMPAGAALVNTARGPIVDETALATAIEAGHLSGAALDVFETEPLPSTSPLRKFDNVIFGSHNGSNTADAVRKVNRLALDNLLRHLDPGPA